MFWTVGKTKQALWWQLHQLQKTVMDIFHGFLASKRVGRLNQQYLKKINNIGCSTIQMLSLVWLWNLPQCSNMLIQTTLQAFAIWFYHLVSCWPAEVFVGGEIHTDQHHWVQRLSFNNGKLYSLWDLLKKWEVINKNTMY